MRAWDDKLWTDEVIQRVMERHRNDLYLNNQQIIEECMKELKLIKATT